MNGHCKSRGVYIILGILLGTLGIHNFYAGHYRNGSIQICLSLLIGACASYLESLSASSGEETDIFLLGVLPIVITVGCLALLITILMDLFTTVSDSEGRKLVR